MVGPDRLTLEEGVTVVAALLAVLVLVVVGLSALAEGGVQPFAGVIFPTTEPSPVKV